jgi:hypothetical protein
MENQHRKITGYRELTEEDIALMNEIKAKGVELDALIKKVVERLDAQNLAAVNLSLTDDKGIDEQRRIRDAEPRRWVSIAKTHFQEGLMDLTRAVAQPSSF